MSYIFIIYFPLIMISVTVIVVGVYGILTSSKKEKKSQEARGINTIEIMVKIILFSMIILAVSMFIFSELLVDEDYSMHYQRVAKERNHKSELTKIALEQAPKLEIILSSDSKIKGIQGSPDGRLLAVGGENGLFLWNVDTHECVWSDTSISPDVLRFSPSGKYLAVAKSDKERSRIFIKPVKNDEGKIISPFRLRSTQGLEKDLAIYDVTTRKRLPLHFSSKKNDTEVILDIAFDAQEKNLHVASGWCFFDEKNIFNAFVHSSKVNLQSGVYGKPHIIPAPNFGFSWTSVSYAKDASRLFHLDGMNAGYSKSPIRRKIIVYDTQNWARRVVVLDKRYEIVVKNNSPFDLDRWAEWEYRGDLLYFLAQEIVVDYQPKGQLARRSYGDLFSVLNLENGEVKDIFAREKKGDGSDGVRKTSLIRIAFSPDGKKAALLGGNNEWNYDVQIYIVRLSDGVILEDIKRNYPDRVERNYAKAPLFLTWVRSDLLVIAEDNSATMASITVKKEGK